MGLFDRLQDEIDARGRQEGLSPIDLLDLPPGLATNCQKNCPPKWDEPDRNCRGHGPDLDEAQAVLDELVPKA